MRIYVYICVNIYSLYIHVHVCIYIYIYAVTCAFDVSVTIGSAGKIDREKTQVCICLHRLWCGLTDKIQMWFLGLLGRPAWMKTSKSMSLRLGSSSSSNQAHVRFIWCVASG